MHALNYCMVLPDPEAQQLAIYIGWLLHRTWGGIVAGAFFVISSIFIMLLLSYLAAAFGHVPAVEGVLYGYKPVLIGLVWFAVLRIGKKPLKNGVLLTLAVAAFVAMFFFTKAALVTFGGAYALLPYVAQAGVEKYGWLSAGQMLDGMAMAETTPGPLIMFVQYVGFMGGWKFSGEFHPALAGTIAALVTTFVTFLPSFWFIFIGAPHIEQMRGNPKITTL